MRTLSCACALLLILSGCADPRLPVGGPADKTPPSIEASVPVNEAVNVSPEFIRFTFSEYVNEGSFAQSFSITPAPAGRPRFTWRRRSVTIRFSESWRDSTTYVITLDTRLRDWRGINIRNPITIAFATGPVIDEGRLRGKVVEPLRGDPVEGFDVLAYPVTNDSSFNGLNEPAYVTKTGEGGTFDLSYVREDDYYVIALQDLNRNRQSDPTEHFAVPPHPAIRAKADTSAPRSAWVISKLDTLAPTIGRIRALSSNRLVIRFSESIEMPQRSPDNWFLADSVTSTPQTVRDVYMQEKDPSVIFLRTDSLTDQTYLLRPDPIISDSSGNRIRSETAYFAGRSRSDTTEVRFEGFLPDQSEAEIPLSPPDIPGVVFNQPVSDSIFSHLVSARDTSGNTLSIYGETLDGTTYRLNFPGAAGETAIITVALPHGEYIQPYRRLTDQELGSLSGVVVPGGDSITVELYLENTRHVRARVNPDSTGNFVFENLPEASYTLRLYIDSNRNGRWDGGSLHPYMRAESISWLKKAITVRRKWDTAPSDTLRLTPTIAISDSTGSE